MGPRYKHPLQLLITTTSTIIITLITSSVLLSIPTASQHRHQGSIGAYKISPKPCSIETRSGTCMFVWECLKSEGKHLGMCVDGFMFGSCCGHNDTANDIHDPTAPSISFGSTTSKPTPTTSSTTPRPITTTTTTTTEIPVTRNPSPPTTASSTTPHFLDLMMPQVEESLPFVTSNSSFFQPPPDRPSFITTTTDKPKTTTTTTTRRPDTTRTTTATTTTPTTTSRTTTIQSVSSSSTIPQSTIVTEVDAAEEDFCGKAPLFPQMRIVGGKQSALGQFPWIASIRRTSFFGFSSTHRCGGALLNSAWVATAGHCVDDLLASQIRVRLGEWDFSGTDEKYPHFESTIVKKVVHPSYNFFTYENDLALLKLEKPINFSKYIRPICLPGNQDLLIGENATVAGWGRLTENGQLPSRLQHVTVPIMSNTRCRELFLKSNRVEHIPDIFLCAGYEKGGQDSCQGDSGGPLQVKGRDGRYFLGGIISWGIGCAEANMPGVCTRISKFTDWIMANVT